MAELVIIDYGMGNLRSVENALRKVAPKIDRIIVSSEPGRILHADRIIFPGQGAARDCMHELRKRGLEAAVREVAGTRPFLGICMGMQILLEHSEENGGTECLGLFKGQVQHFKSPHEADNKARLKIPHMGWNRVFRTKPHPLWEGIPDGSRFYFVHSYHVTPSDQECRAATTNYGFNFCSAIARDNIFALQCHPEKSAEVGLRLFYNFARWGGSNL